MNKNKKIVGVVGIDIRLTDLAEIVKETTIGESRRKLKPQCR